MPESPAVETAVDRAPSQPRPLAGVRVLVVMPSIPLQGMERSTLEIVRVLQDHGAEALVITEGTHGHKVQAAVDAIGARWAPVRVIDTYEERLHVSGRPRQQWAVVRAWTRAAWGIRREMRRFRPTHVYVTSFVAFLYSLPAVVRGRTPVVFRLPNPPPARAAGIRHGVVRRLWKLLLRRADVVVCNCRYTAGRVAQLGARHVTARVIPNIAPRRAGGGGGVRLDAARFTVVYLGRIRPEKGVRELVEAALRVIRERADVDFVLAGEHAWQNPFARELTRELERDGAADRIRLLGEMEDVHALLEQCRLHVCPSISEGESFPNVVLEAKSCALPSVVFPTGGLPEAVTHLEDGYVCRDRSPQALYEGLRYFLDDGDALRRAGAAAKASLAEYSHERVGRLWVDVFDPRRRPDA